MSMVVEAHLDPRMELYHNTKEVTGGDIRAGGGSNHPCVIPFSYGRKGPNNTMNIMFGPMASTSNTILNESQPKYT